MALVIESDRIVLLSVKRAKVTEFCMIKTTYSTKNQARASRKETESKLTLAPVILPPVP